MTASSALEDTSVSARNGVFTAVGFFLASAWITLSLRIWVRITVVKGLGWDDGLLIASALLFTGYCTVVLLIETEGGAQHLQLLDFPGLARLVAIVIASFDLYIATMVFFKISLGVFYLRFVIRLWQRHAVYATIIINTLYGTFLFFIATFNCGDPSHYLDNELKGVCLDQQTVYGVQLAGAIINTVTDWILALLPIFILMKATMPTYAKISAGIILLLGCCGSLVSLLRIRYMKGLTRSDDFFNSAIPLCIWSVAECGICISAASMATLRPLFRGLMERSTQHLHSFSFGSRSKSDLNSSDNTRQSEMFGEFQRIPLQYRERDLESQQTSHSSITPLLKNIRVLSKMGIAREVVNEAQLGEQSQKQSTAGQARESLGRKSLHLKTTVRDLESRLSRPAMVRKQSVREKPISRPIPHIRTQMAPPTPTFGQRPQHLVRIDSRRLGSPNWVRDVNSPGRGPSPGLWSRHSQLPRGPSPFSEGQPF